VLLKDRLSKPTTRRRPQVVLYGETNELHPLAALGGAKQKGLSHLGFVRFKKNSNKTPW